jgi:hypothetical protein
MLHVHNRYVQQYKQVCQLSPAEVPQYDLVLLASGTPDKRRYNLPTANEVAGVMPGGLVGARGGGADSSARAVCCVGANRWPRCPIGLQLSHTHLSDCDQPGPDCAPCAPALRPCAQALATSQQSAGT